MVEKNFYPRGVDMFLIIKNKKKATKGVFFSLAAKGLFLVDGM